MDKTYWWQWIKYGTYYLMYKDSLGRNRHVAEVNQSKITDNYNWACRGLNGQSYGSSDTLQSAMHQVEVQLGR